MHTLIGLLRGATLRPGFVDNLAPEGCQHDQGLTIWEMPDRAGFTAPRANNNGGHARIREVENGRKTGAVDFHNLVQAQPAP